MSWNGKTKDNSRLYQEEVERYIASQTSLTKNQVKECFKSYAEMIKLIYSDNHIEKDMTIPLPYLGKFYLSKRNGRKDGTKYLLPDLYGGRGDWIVAKNEPSYYLLKFKTAKNVSDYIKKGTSFIEKQN